MKKLIALLFSVHLTVFSLVAQSLGPSFSTDAIWMGTETDSSSALVWGDYSLESGAIQQSFLNKFVFGGYIDDDLKDKTNNNLKSNNRIFFDSEAGAGYFYHLKSDSVKSSKLYILLRNQQFTSIEFPPQLFQLVFYGNGSSKTEQGKFSNASGYSLRGNRLDIGLHRNFVAENGRKWGVSANIGVMQLFDQWVMDWPRGQLSTEPDGTAITFDNQAHFRISDTSKNGFLSTEGWGIAGDFQISAVTGSVDWFFSIKDLGYTWMNESSLSITLDSSFTYQGGDLAKWLATENDLFPSGDQDSLLQLVGAQAEFQPFSRSLPALISVSAMRHYGDWNVLAGANYRIDAYDLPLVFARVGYNNQPLAMQYGATVAIGGAGMLKFGLQLRKSFKNKLDIHLGLNHLNALALPGTFSGFSAFGLMRIQL